VEEKNSPQATRERLDGVEVALVDTERELMAINSILGDLLYERYSDRMGFEKDGSRTKDGVVVWPERMVE